MNILDQHDIQRVSNIHDAKQIIDTYQLWKSQLVFTIAERIADYRLPVPVPHTTVASQVMCDEASGRRSMFNGQCSSESILLVFFVSSEESMPSTPAASTILDEDTVICTPRKGAWAGGDEILMMIPKLDRRKGNNSKERQIAS